MAFVKEFRNIDEPLPEWEYLNSIGVRDMFGKSIANWTTELVVDKENNYYLIPQGHTGRAYTDEDVFFYAMCINDKVINMEVLKNRKGNCIDKNYEVKWIVRKVMIPKGCELEGLNISKIIEEAFIVNTYDEVATTETVKEVTVEITEPPLVDGLEGGER
ncbi:MAG: hypothetical protein IJ326_07425 [Lachnospiraceae bacterium]|nr:hypothetical protein [Lachnospiraceae bacterium]